MTLTHWSLAALAVAVLAGCSSGPQYTAEECAVIDWRGLGLSDGQTGQPLTSLNDEILGCRPFNIEPDMEAYLAGREDGLSSYCVPGALLEASVQALGDPFVCDPFSEDQRLAFETGRDTRSAVQRWQTLKGRYDQLLAQRDQINAEGSQLTERYRQTADETTRQQIALRIEALRQQLEAVELDIDEISPDIAREERDYRAAVAAYEEVRDRFRD